MLQQLWLPNDPVPTTHAEFRAYLLQVLVDPELSRAVHLKDDLNQSPQSHHRNNIKGGGGLTLVHAGQGIFVDNTDVSNPIVIADVTEIVNEVPSSGSAQTIPDPQVATMNDITLDANCTFTFPALTPGNSFSLRLKQGTGGGFTATWPVGVVRWMDHITPILSIDAGVGDIFSFTCFDGLAWDGIFASRDSF